ncbi:MAG: hypothetical protein AAFY72_01215 [Cyanobacteria bacterium J06649_4]
MAPDQALSERRQRAIALVNQLPQSQLFAVVQLLELLADPVLTTEMSSEEMGLLEVIQQQLPVQSQKRLDELRYRCEWGELSDNEQQELIEYEDRLEQWRGARFEALVQLAQLKNIDIATLNRQVLSQSRPSNAA